MANEEHLTRLKQGVEAWNQWRAANRDMRPSFGGAALPGTNLSHADLSHADLRGANLSRADLTEANLHKADSTGAYFRRANLSRADLSHADLTQANLDGADLTEAQFGRTTIADVDLSSVYGLETIKHEGPLTIGIDTLYRSQGNLPEAFLRGAGVPEGFIPYIKSLVRRPFELYPCFISYSSKDQHFAERLHADLQNKGVRCWYAPEDIRGGRKLDEQIDQAIHRHERLLLVLSTYSMQSE
jgi:hypothetical protein